MSFSRFLEGFIIGGVTGAAVALLLAPSSGEEIRGQIQSEAEKLRAEVGKAASDRRAELEEQLAALRAPHKSGAA